MSKQKYVIIVAGGSGKRMGSEVPKQFIEVAGMPVLMHTIQRFYDFDNSVKIVVVLPEDQHALWGDLIHRYGFKIYHQVTKGGKERFDSVKNGLSVINEESLIAVHDGVRPLVSPETIQRCFNEAESKDAAIPVMPAVESIRMETEAGSIAVDRSKYFMVQTPQVFESEVLKKAYCQSFSNTFTDDASVVESLGYKIAMVEGNSENIKVTRPLDLVIAEALLTKKE